MSHSLRQLFRLLICVGISLGSAQALATNVDTSEPVVEISKKRLEPAKVKPVTIGAIRYEVVLWGKDKGFLQDSGNILENGD